MDICGYCARSLKGRSPAAKFCSASCRTFAIRASKERDWSWHANLIRESMTSGDGWRESVARVRESYSRSFELFGPDVIAAAARPLPSGACRWHLALATATVSERSLTVQRGAFAGLRLLLGDPCEKCVRRLRADLTARVTRGSDGPQAVTASVAPELDPAEAARLRFADPAVFRHDGRLFSDGVACNCPRCLAGRRRAGGAR